MLIIFIVVFILVLSSLSIADEEKFQDDNINTLPTITVNARKREEELNKVPLQVKKFDEWEIDNANIRNRNDIDFMDTSLTNIETVGGIENRLLIRGVGGSFGIGEYSVGMFIDGVYQGADLYYGRELIDIEYIEVLKGPQNSLYGKSTIGGAINIKTKDPIPEKLFIYKQHFGQRDFHRETFIANMPLVDEVLFSRIVIDYQDFDGFHTNSFTGSDRDDDRQKNIRAKLQWLPFNNLIVDSSYSFRERDSGSYASKLVTGDKNYNSGNHGLDKPQDLEIDSRQFSTQIAYRTDSGYEFNSITSYSNVKEEDLVDLDYTSRPPSAVDPFTNVQAKRRVRGKDHSQELRLTSPKYFWGDWILGAYYFHLNDKYFQSINLNTFTSVSLPPAVNFSSITKSYTYSIFGETNINISKKNILGLGLRYDYDVRTFADLGDTGFRDNENFDAFSPRVSLTHLLSDNISLFATGSVGYKAGGFNPPGIEPFKEEKSSTVEIGFKSKWPELQLALNGSVFHNWLEDQQITELDIPTVTEFIGNSGKSTIRGIELDATWQPISNLTLRGSLSLLDSEFTDFTLTTIGPDGLPGTFNLDGNSLRYVEDYQASLSLAYDSMIFDDWLLTSRLDLNAKGEKYWGHFNIYKQEPYELANLSFTINKQQTQMSLYIENLLNQRYFSTLVPEFEFPFVNRPLGIVGPKRFVGFKLSHEF